MMIFLLCFFPFLTLASSEAFPVKTIFIQTFNFSLFFILLIFLLRKPAKEFFKKQREDFFLFEKQAKEQEEKKKKEHQIWSQKVQEILHKKQNIKAQALEEGNKFQQKKQRELEDISQKMADEAQEFFHLESERLKAQTLKQLKQSLSNQAEEILKEQSTDATWQDKIYKNFEQQLERKAKV